MIDRKAEIPVYSRSNSPTAHGGLEGLICEREGISREAQRQLSMDGVVARVNGTKTIEFRFRRV